jgi:hypothetical protein
MPLVAAIKGCQKKRKKYNFYLILPLMPTLVTPPETAFNAYSICTSFPEGEKVVSEKLYLSAITCFWFKKERKLARKTRKKDS